jgi:predicted GTPase
LDKVYDFLHHGENFELIDGDNMEFCSDQLKYLFNKFENEKVFIISVLGLQSSGKSTLLNYIFGCQFFSSVGRCTRGVYGSLLKVNHKHFSYILILDTEGLQDPAKPNSEFDKKIVMFCLSVS